jgi:DNA end-binding protein Ku
MPRAIWSGTISFGLVSVPVRMFTAVSEHKLHFNLLHRKDSSPIGYEKVCKKEGKPVPDDEIVKAYEISKGKFVEVEDEDFEAAAAEGGHAFDIEQFVEVEEIDPIYFEHSYYLAPQDGGEKVYTLLVRAMDEAGLAAIGTFVMRDREHLGCLRIREGMITLERMYFADEIRELDGILPERTPAVDKRQLELAVDLIARMQGSFNHAAYKDRYHDRLLAIVEQKRKGETITVEKPKERRAPDDLMAALEASLGAAVSKRAKAPRKKKAKSTRGKA